MQWEQLDWAYLHRWAAILGVDGLLARLLEEAAQI